MTWQSGCFAPTKSHSLPAAATLPAQDDLQSPGKFHPILSVGESNVYIIVYLSIIILYVYIYIWYEYGSKLETWTTDGLVDFCVELLTIQLLGYPIDPYILICILYMISIDIKPAASHALHKFALGCGVYYPLFVLRKSRFLIIILLSHQTN